MSFRFRHAICNEVFDKWAFQDACRAMRTIGYEGIEIAPFTLAENPATIPAKRRAECRRIMADEGLEFVGLHWLMVSPKGLHVTTPDAELRERSWQHIRNLIDLCADLGDGGVMVFGSPAQRGTTGGSDQREATKKFVDGLASVASQAEERGVTILIEALPRAQTDVVLSLDEASRLAAEIGSPAIQTMFDTHNAIDEVEPHADLIDRHMAQIRHLHVNEMDGRHPGTGGYDFKPVLRALERNRYGGWVSLEAFDFLPGAETVARESLTYLKSEIEKLHA